MLTTEGARMAASASKQLVDVDVRELRWHLRNLSGVLATAAKLAGFSFFFCTFMLGTPGIKLKLHGRVISDDVAFAAVAAMLAATGLFVLAAVISLMSIVWGTNCALHGSGAKRASAEFGITFRRAVCCLLGGVVALMLALALVACSALAYGMPVAESAGNSGANMGGMGGATSEQSASSLSKAAVLAVLICVVTTLVLACPAKDAVRYGYPYCGFPGGTSIVDAWRTAAHAKSRAPIAVPEAGVELMPPRHEGKTTAAAVQGSGGVGNASRFVEAAVAGVQSQLVSAAGLVVQKHGRRGLPHSRVLRYDQASATLAWAEDAASLTKRLSAAVDSTSSRARGGVVALRSTTLRPNAATRLLLVGGRMDGAPELVVECPSREERDALHAALTRWIDALSEPPCTDAIAPGSFVSNPGVSPGLS